MFAKILKEASLQNSSLNSTVVEYVFNKIVS